MTHPHQSDRYDALSTRAAPYPYDGFAAGHVDVSVSPGPAVFSRVGVGGARGCSRDALSCVTASTSELNQPIFFRQQGVKEFYTV